MRATLLFLISAAAAFVLPPGLNDGVYRAYIDERGNEVHERLSGPEAGAVVSRRSPAPETSPASVDLSETLFKRDWTVWCGCGFTLDHGDCDAAVADMKNQVGGGVEIQAHVSYYSIRGSVVFFSCNQGDGQLYMDVDSVTFIAGQITDACGLYIAGTFARQGYGDEASGYMRYSSGLDFCANAKTSPAHSC